MLLSPLLNKTAAGWRLHILKNRSKSAFSMVEVIVVTLLIGIIFSMVMMVYKFVFLKQTMASQMMEGTRDIVLTVNYLKSDLNSALINPSFMQLDSMGRQKTDKTVAEALGESISEGEKKFSFIISEGSEAGIVTYEIDKDSVLKRTVYDVFKNVLSSSILSRGKITNAALACKVFKSGSDRTVCMNIALKIRTRVIDKGAASDADKDFSFNIFPYVLNNTLKNAEFKDKPAAY
jgi:type II secretory pathway pseudopilin PulG